MGIEEDPARQLIELAITSGRSHQSPQTRLIQFCHESIDEGVNHTIPLYDNFLFALALLRTRSAANIEEGKKLIDHLLHFQSRLPKSKGNFPIYLHEYPFCPYWFQAAHLIPCFYWILKRFGPILGADLEKRITTSSHHALNYLWEAHQEKNPPFQISIKIACASVAFGRLWKDSEVQKKGQTLLDQLLQESQKEEFGTWYSSAYLAETLIGLQMVYTKISESPWKDFWTYLQKTWHPHARSYCGPSVQVLQWDTEPEATLYDLFCGYFSGEIYPYHSYYDSPYQLQGALIQSTDDKLSSPQFPLKFNGSVSGHSWEVTQDDCYGIAGIETKGAIPPELKKGFHPFRLIWGDRSQVHSLVMQGGNPTQVLTSVDGNQSTIDLWLAEPVEVKDKDKNIEVSLYCNREEENDWTVRGKKATTFQLGEPLLMASRLLNIGVTFELIEGSGRFFGHIMPSNRPAQKKCKGKHRFDAYDMHIFLRTVRRNDPCRLRITLDLSSPTQR